MKMYQSDKSGMVFPQPWFRVRAQIWITQVNPLLILSVLEKSKYDQEMPQSHTEDQPSAPMAPYGRAT